MSVFTGAVSSTFIWRRIHSLMGLWLVLYLLEHFLVNSQATLWIGDDGSGFVQMVNSLESLPYLQVIEIVFIGLPFAVHMVWGVQRALSAKTNSSQSDGSTPSLKYGRNRAFRWQRLTSWILLFGVIGHVVQMRFVEMPRKIFIEGEKQHLVQVRLDEGLPALAKRLHVTLYDKEEVAKKPELHFFHPTAEERVVVASTPGTAMLFMVRETFKSPLMIGLYTIFVLAAAFHAFNGFWTSLITWGALLSYRSQRAMIPICWIGFALLSFLGLAAIWGSYWVNLR